MRWCGSRGFLSGVTRGMGPAGSCVTQDISERLSRMVLGHMAGDQDAVKRELDDIVAKHVKVVQKPQGGLH